MTMRIRSDPFDLERFIAAQKDNYERALAEMERGRKTSHWMWFIFPQVAGLGSSEMSRRYAVGSFDEARAYLAHPVLGVRYRECVSVLQDLVGASAEAVFGAIDAAKLMSSLTLFSRAAPNESLFTTALERWFEGTKDTRTLKLLVV